jgi:hypothetical protein
MRVKSPNGNSKKVTPIERLHFLVARAGVEQADNRRK